MNSPFVLGKRSRMHMEGIHPDLVAGIEMGILITPVDFGIIDGVRTKPEAINNAILKVGSANSLHLVQKDGYAHAFDFQPVGYKPGGSLVPFRRCAAALLQAFDELDILIQWGNDWDGDGVESLKDFDGPVDFYHMQKPRALHAKRAQLARIRRMALRAAGNEDVI